MTKKIFAMFLAVLMVVSMLPTTVFAADATCPGKGSNNHTVKNCDFTEVGVVAPGCGSIGYTINKCNVCGDEFRTEEVPATGEHVLVELEAKAPTCGAYGHEAGQKCSVCGKEFPGAPIAPKVGVGYSCEWTEWTPANVDCTTGGVKTRECKCCGVQDTPIVITLDQTGGVHQWDNENPKLVTPATPEATGVAIVECSVCKITKEVEVLYEHDHVWLNHAEVPANCTTSGMMEYDECRVCGMLMAWMEDWSYDSYSYVSNYREVTIEELVVDAFHVYEHPAYGCNCTDLDAPHTATCVDHVLVCRVCEERVTVKIDHYFKNWSDDGHEATCLKSGYEESICETCKIAVATNVLPALNHNEVTVTVPATCGTYGYTFTYCTRQGCTEGIAADHIVFPKNENADNYPMVDEKYTKVTGSMVNVVDDYGMVLTADPNGYYLAVNQNTTNGSVLYFTGEMNGYYLAVSNDVSKAAVVYVELVHHLLNANYGAYRLYFYNDENVKTYIDIYEYEEDKVGVQLTTEVPEGYLKWNSSGYFYATIHTEEYGYSNYTLGCYKDYEDMSVKYAFTSKFTRMSLSKVGVFGSVNVVSYDFDTTAKNSENHEWQSEILQPNSCTEDGVELHWCEYCDESFETVIPAGHNFVDYADGATIKVDGEEIPVKVLPTCEDGYKYQYCNGKGCKATKMITYPGYGHIWGDLIEVEPTHTATTVYDHYLCLCGEVKNVKRKSWTDSRKHYDTLQQAKDAHPGLDMDSKETASAGSCFEYGLFKYMCNKGEDCCGLPVYVKIPGTGVHVAPELGANFTETNVETVRFNPDRTGYFTIVTANLPADLELWIVDLETNKGVKIYENITNETILNLDANRQYRFRSASAEVNEIEFTQVAYEKAATCTATGYHITYTCVRCEDVVGNKALGVMEILPMVAHTWEENEDYEKTVCENPNLDYADPENMSYTVFCKDCGLKIFDTKKLAESELTACEGLQFVYFECACGDEHIKGYNVFKHNYVELPHVAVGDKRADGSEVKAGDADVTYLAPTCYAEGYYTVVCTFCKDVKTEKIDKVQHTNAAGEKFDTKCTSSSVVDRHCVVCHEYWNHANYGKAHNCMAVDKDGNFLKDTSGEYICLGKCVFLSAHNDVTTLHPSTCLENAYTKTTCSFCGRETVKFFDGGWNGHMPAAAEWDDETQSYVKYGNYYYDWYTYVSIVLKTDAEGKQYLAEERQTYYAQFELVDGKPGYIPATYTSEGSVKAFCQRCKAVHEWTLPKLEGLGFTLTTNTTEYTYGSMVEVTVSANGYNELVHGFDFDLNYFTSFSIPCDATCAEDCKGHVGYAKDLIYVGYTTVNNDFMFKVSNPKVAIENKYMIEIVGQAANDANGKIQNITINEETALVKLFFRVATTELSVANFVFNDNTANAYAYDAEALNKNYPFVSVYCSPAEKTALVRKFADFNNDGVAHITDLYQAMTLLTGEQEDGKTYDVSVDVDKDGVVTVEDILVLYEAYVGNYENEELFFMGIGEAETELLMELHDVFTGIRCAHCKAELADDYAYCPECGRNPKK